MTPEELEALLAYLHSYIADQVQNVRDGDDCPWDSSLTILRRLELNKLIEKNHETRTDSQNQRT